MCKLINIVWIICLPFLIKSQNREQLNCVIKQFANINPDKTIAPIDTIVGQIRLINIFKSDSIVDIGLQFYNEKKDLYYLRYYISSEDTIKLPTQPNSDYLVFRKFSLLNEDYFPLILIFNIENSVAYLYYYWTNTEERYLKTEKLDIIDYVID